VELEHVVVSRMQGQVVATARCVVVVFNYQLQRPTRIPDDLRRAFERSMAIAGGAVESGT
jgi:acyl-CoA thioesterase FadM